MPVIGISEGYLLLREMYYSIDAVTYQNIWRCGGYLPDLLQIPPMRSYHVIIQIDE